MSSGVQPLNPELYRRLQKNFGNVLIANPGEGFVATVRRGLDGRPKQQIAHSGEYYRVCCPYCKDMRSRLWVNHKFGVFDENTRSKNTHLAICYNENCLTHPAQRQRFEKINLPTLFSILNFAIMPVTTLLHTQLNTKGSFPDTKRP